MLLEAIEPIEKISFGQELAEAIKSGTIFFVYSPIKDNNNEIISYELLTRFNGGTSDIETAFKQFNQNKEFRFLVLNLLEKEFTEVETRYPNHIAINLSPYYLNDDNVRRELLKILSPNEDRSLPYPNVDLEITEDACLDEPAIKFLQKIRQYGYSLSIDDLGSGVYSEENIEYIIKIIQDLKPQKIKLDYELIKGKTTEEILDLIEYWIKIVVYPCYNFFSKNPTLIIEGMTIETPKTAGLKNNNSDKINPKENRSVESLALREMIKKLNMGIENYSISKNIPPDYRLKIFIQLKPEEL